MKKIAFYDTKPYDKESFEKYNTGYEIEYIESKLNASTAVLAKGCDAVCAFVNDTVDAAAIDMLYDLGIRVIAMRCAGYSNVDFRRAYGKINVVRVPAYSPHAVAEHAAALLFSVNRKVHKAYGRTRDFNFNISGFTGMDLNGKTVGVVGTGKIGKAFISICKGIGMRVIAFDPYPDKKLEVEYVSLDEIFEQSDVISLHCPLTDENKRMLSAEAFSKMKQGVYIINTSRGALIDTQALIDALNDGKVRGAGLDVYEEEGDFFFEDYSNTIVHDDILSLLISKPNVLLTSHQAFLTDEALEGIAKTTFKNLDAFFSGGDLPNEVCYQCDSGRIVECRGEKKGRCF